MIVFQYCPLLQRDNVLEDFCKVHDVLLDNIYVSLRRTRMLRLSPEAQRLVQQYGIFLFSFLGSRI